MKKIEFTTKIFVIGSIFAFFAFILILFFSEVFFCGFNNEQYQIEKKGDYKYYLNEDFNQADPFITKIPNLKDMLAGPIISPLDPIFGNPEASVAIIIFSDYECEFCKKQEEQLKELVNKYQDKVKLIRKDYPDDNIDSISYQAAIAGRCAGKQNIFWQYHDALYENSDSLGGDVYSGLAASLGINSNEFEECLLSEETRQLISDNILEANALDISGVPFMYINSQEVMGQISQEDLEKIIEIELKKQ